MNLKTTFSKLKNAVIGTTTTKIDDSLDKAVKDIASYKTQSGRLGYIELLKSLINKQNTSDIFGSSNILKTSQGSMPTPAMYGQGGRLARYKSYEAIISNITYCYRALNVITDNVLSPDDITKQSLDIKPQTYLEDEIDTESKTKLAEEVIKQVKLEQNLDIIIKNTLSYGDFFVEIGTAKTALTSRAYLAESYNTEMVDTIHVEGETIEDEFDIKIDYSSFNEAEDKNKDNKKDDENEIDPKDVKLMFHHPRNVIKLQSEIFPVCFGYLVFPKYVAGMQCNVGDHAINDICLAILKNLERKVPEISELRGNKELQDILRYIISTSDIRNGRHLNIRFVSPDKMQHFKVPSTKFEPYGESIFDSVSYTAKLLISMETALAIQRLSRSTEKRLIAIEMGLPRDAKKLVENLKEQFRKRKVSLDTFGTVDTIPSMITTFEDIYVPQKDGKPFVNIDTFTAGNVDVRSKVDELKFIRDELIASLGVPPPFLNIEENVNAKNTLTNENVLFARTIIGHQRYITIQLTDLIQKIFKMINPEESLTLLDNITITLPTPKSLQYEMLSRKINDIVNLIESLERIGVPKEYSKKKFLEDIDWQEVDNYQVDADIDRKLGIAPKEEEMGFGMGGGMAGGGYTPGGAI